MFLQFIYASCRAIWLHSQSKVAVIAATSDTRWKHRQSALMYASKYSPSSLCNLAFFSPRRPAMQPPNFTTQPTNSSKFRKCQADTDESCTWCQRETGSAFALLASIEKDRVKLLNNCKPDWIQIPSASGKGQHRASCPSCKISLFSIYGEDINKPTWLIIVGTLDKPDVLAPYLTAHIFTSTKQSWLKLGDDVPVFEEDYDRAKVWSKEQLDRYRKVFGEDP